ncbi:MAG: glucose 1-dehydrogenase [Thermoleophilia bacterium]|nr:glucose 1-dehydrogenase [Thermoleophilia bacterium]
MNVPQPKSLSVDQIRNLFDLTGRVAVITGGSGALGEASATALAAYGADLVLTSRTVSSLEATAARVREIGRKVTTISCDVKDSKSVEAMVGQTLEEHGKIDILVTSAGIANRFPAEEFPIDEWQKIMDINVRGTFLCCQAVGKHMIERGQGHIITVSSIRGLLGHPGGYSAYGTSKGAVHLLTRQLATEWAKYQINVNSIAPCIFWTPLTEQVLNDPELYKVFMSRIPWGRAAEPRDFMGMIVYLASDASEFVTGQIMYVDGGSSAG